MNCRRNSRGQINLLSDIISHSPTQTLLGVVPICSAGRKHHSKVMNPLLSSLLHTKNTPNTTAAHLRREPRHETLLVLSGLSLRRQKRQRDQTNVAQSKTKRRPARAHLHMPLGGALGERRLFMQIDADEWPSREFPFAIEPIGLISSGRHQRVAREPRRGPLLPLTLELDCVKRHLASGAVESSSGLGRVAEGEREVMKLQLA